MNRGKQANLRGVLLATTALVGVVLVDGGAESASAGQAAGCAPAGATAGTVTCAPQPDNYNPGGIGYQLTGPLTLSIAPGATVTGVVGGTGSNVYVSGQGGGGRCLHHQCRHPDTVELERCFIVGHHRIRGVGRPHVDTADHQFRHDQQRDDTC